MKQFASFYYLLWITASVLLTACVDSPLPSAPGINNADADAGQNSQTCIDSCQAGERTCLDDQTTLLCMVNEQGCLEFTSPTACLDDLQCFNGLCLAESPTCNDECSPGDPPRCNENGQLESCADHQQTGCLTYGAPIDCEAGTYCEATSGRCVEPQCEENCQEGETICELRRIATCKKDARGCFSFVDSRECNPGHACSDGQCRPVQTCANECIDSDLVCTAAGEARLCGDWNSSGCFVFSEAIDCGAGQTCRGDDCVAVDSCQDQCLRGETVCIGNKIATCDDHDQDGCVEFDKPTDCPTPGNTCQLIDTQSLCRPSPQSGAVLINEIFYDPLGADLRDPEGNKCQNASPNCTSPTFIELSGPPGLRIAGYKIDMINGADGNSYNSAILPEDARLDGRGFAVIAMEQADNFLSYAAPFQTNVYYVLKSYAANEDALQNDAESIILYDASGQPADAVGYGHFNAAQLPNFRGQGQPAPRAASGRSVGRIHGRANSNNNAADFSTFYPTPGMPNQDLFINEVYTNQPGANDGSETFVELAAPILGWEDLSLDGYVLRAIAGHNGKDYIFTATTPGISLNGKKLNDATSVDGYVVLCHNAAKQPLRSLCTVHYDGSPFYAGPDNFILEYQQNPIDSIGYGTFASSDTFVGEGRPASYTSTDSGRSLARGQHSDPNTILDTNDNSVDFHRVSPTPGTGNGRP